MKMRTYWENERRKLLGQPLIQDTDNQENTAIDAPLGAVLRQGEDFYSPKKSKTIYVVLGEHKTPDGGGRIIDIANTKDLTNAIVLLTETEGESYLSAKESGIAIQNRIYYENDTVFHVNIRGRMGISYLVDDMFAFWNKHEKYKTCWIQAGIMYNPKTGERDYHIAEHSIDMFYNKSERTICIKKDLVAFDGYEDPNGAFGYVIPMATNVNLSTSVPMFHTHGMHHLCKEVYVLANSNKIADYTKINDNGKRYLDYPKDKNFIKNTLNRVSVLPRVPSRGGGDGGGDFPNSAHFDFPLALMTTEAIWLYHQDENNNLHSVKVDRTKWENI